jgi:hypothetical protein
VLRYIRSTSRSRLNTASQPAISTGAIGSSVTSLPWEYHGWAFVILAPKLRILRPLLAEATSACLFRDPDTARFERLLNGAEDRLWKIEQARADQRQTRDAAVERVRAGIRSFWQRFPARASLHTALAPMGGLWIGSPAHHCEIFCPRVAKNKLSFAFISTPNIVCSAA